MCPHDQSFEIRRRQDSEPEQPTGTGGGADRFLTTVECADMLRLSPRTLERMRVQGAGPRYVKAGPGVRAKVLYRLSDIVAWTNARCFGSTSEYVAR